MFHGKHLKESITIKNQRKMDRKEYLKNSLLLEKIELAQYLASAIEKIYVLEFQGKSMSETLIELEKIVKEFCVTDLSAFNKISILTTEEYQEIKNFTITILFDKYITW